MSNAYDLALDYDDCLVGHKKYGEPKKWLPGAQEALRALLKSGRTIVIHSCRANWAEGCHEIHEKLFESGFGRFMEAGDLEVWMGEGKPSASVYLDDKAVRFGGSWDGLVPKLRELSR